MSAHDCAFKECVISVNILQLWSFQVLLNLSSPALAFEEVQG